MQKTTGKLRRQHRQLLQLCTQLDEVLTFGAATQALRVRSLLGALSAVLASHIALEDGVVYPVLSSHPDPEVRELAIRNAREMGSLWSDFDAFVRRWASADAIAGDPSLFTHDTRVFVDALLQRIAREDGNLYPLVERTTGSGRAPPGLHAGPGAGVRGRSCSRWRAS